MSNSKLRTTGLLPALLLGTAGILALALIVWPAAAEAPHRLPPPQFDQPLAAASGTERAVFAGGCFWGVQGVFQHVKGVRQVLAGYAGGAARTADYETVSTGMTGHAESVEVRYDPSQISYGALLHILFSAVSDPTQRDRQGPDVGSQYRSAVFPQTAEQQRVAERYLAQLNEAHVFAEPLATTIEAGKIFYPAEAYHQDFLLRHPDHPYIARFDLPKVEALKALFPARFEAQASASQH
jgi:peptide-methionine (S)-S-oxide reductase